VHVLLALHAATGLTAIALGQRLGRRALLLAAIGPVAATAWLLVQLPAVTDGELVEQRASWVAGLDLTLSLRLDGLATVLALLVAGIGVAVVAYAWHYFTSASEHVGRLAGLLALFAGAMLGLVLADDLLVLYTCWELTAITSYLLIGNQHTSAEARAGALHALVVTSAGGLCMLVGFVLLGQEAGTYRLSEILAEPPSGRAVSVGLVLVLLGVFTKSAQYPFHGWLPGAMAAPTPVSAYLHAATMVKAGVYLLARLAPAFAVLGWWRPVVLVVGVATMVGGGLRALRQTDLKLLLAHGTVSQLGLLVVLLGAGTPATTAAGGVLLLAHGAFKATLFMVVGIIDRRTGTRDLRELPALGPSWRAVRVVTAVSLASMAGVPLVLGFIAKEAAYTAVNEAGFGGAGPLLVGIVGGSVLTVAYSLRFGWAVLGARGDGTADDPGLGFVAPAAVLATATTALGLLPGTLDPLLGAVVPGTHLALWHGVGTPLLLSGLTLAAGVALFAARAPVGRALAAGARVPSSTDAYQGILRGLNRLADRVTGVVQSGSLPVYTGVILLTAAVLPGAALVLGTDDVAWPEVLDVPAHVPVLGLVVGAAVAAATIRRRLSAALFLGVVGYGMAGLFVVQGAPDLALTQVAIETLSTVLFVLVLRHLPARFEPRSSRRRRALRLAISTAVAASVFAFAIVAGSSRTAEPVSGEMVDRALPDGNGRNVVNVILVDFRGFDTLGEITVLASAAIGMVALARAGRGAPRSQRRAAEQAP
jgi:multicomponent Na+:H+ antiporter subunit A